MDWSTYAWLKRGSRRVNILSKINNSNLPLSVKDIRKKENVALPQVSATVKELLKKELIDCLNPKDKIGKLYRINKKGQDLLGAIEND